MSVSPPIAALVVPATLVGWWINDTLRVPIPLSVAVQSVLRLIPLDSAPIISLEFEVIFKPTPETSYKT
jgi:hypothetical protein